MKCWSECSECSAVYGVLCVVVVSVVVVVVTVIVWEGKGEGTTGMGRMGMWTGDG